MHILLIHQAFASLDEAGGTRHYELSKFLVANGHQVTVIASPVSYLTGAASLKKAETVDGIRILRAYTYVALHRSFVHRVFSFISFMVSSFLIGYRVKDVDIVWGTSPPIFQGFTAWLLARVKKAKFLFEVRDLWPDFAIAVGVLKNPTLIKMSFWLEKFLYQHADQMMVNSPAYVKHVLSRGCKKVELIPNGADLSMFSEQDDGGFFRQKLGIDEKFVAVYAGAHGISNDLEVVLKSAAKLKDHPQIQIVFVGDGKEKNNLQQIAAIQNLSNVTFVPSVPKNEMAMILAASQVCIAILKPLDEYKTTYPNKVFDYMASGKPIVLAIDGVIRDVVEDAHCGIYVEPGNATALANAVISLYQQPQQAAELGRNGRNYLREHFDRQILAEKLLKLIEII